jgi:hypothetical protein
MTSPDLRKALSLGDQPSGWQTVSKAKQKTKAANEKKKSNAGIEKSFGEVAKEFHEKIMYEAFLEKCTKASCSGITSQCFKAHDRSSWQSVRRDLRKQEYCARLCYFVQQPDGRCLNGDNCTYAHSKCEVSYHPEVYKTRACHHKPNSSYCGNLLCSFYHVFADGSDDHREPSGSNSENMPNQDSIPAPLAADDSEKSKLSHSSSADKLLSNIISNSKAASATLGATTLIVEDRLKSQTQSQSENISIQNQSNDSAIPKSSAHNISKILSNPNDESITNLNQSSRSISSATPLTSSDPIWNFPASQPQVPLNHKVIAKPSVNLNLGPFVQSQDNLLATPPGVNRTTWGASLDYYAAPTSSIPIETSRVASTEEEVGKSEDDDAEDKTLFMYKKFIFFYRDFQGPVIYIEPVRATSNSVLPSVVKEVAQKYEIQHYMLILENIGASRMYLDHKDFVRILQKCEKDESAKYYMENLTILDPSKATLSDSLS